MLSFKKVEVFSVDMEGKYSKDHCKTESYQSIALLSITTKLASSYLLGFRRNHATIDQIHRITDVIEKKIEYEKVSWAVFLNFVQTFDRVWQQGVILNENASSNKMNTLSLKTYELIYLGRHCTADHRRLYRENYS